MVKCKNYRIKSLQDNKVEFIVGNLNEVYQFRILGDARNEGSNCVYKVELAGGNTSGVPSERLLAGERFSREAAFVEDSLSRKVGDVRFAAPTTMRNEWSTIRKQHKVGGDMMNQKFACGIPMEDKNTGKSKVITTWIPYVEWQFEEEFQEEKYNALAFGRSNRNENGEYMNIGKSGNVIKTGAGLYQQMEAGNTRYYNEFSLKMLEDALYRISASKLGLDERQFVLMTGERGAMAFHKAVLDTVSGWTPFTINGDAIGAVAKTTSPLHNNALKAGFQFTEFLAPNGVKVKLEINPYYDDPVRNKIQFNGGPAFSSRFDIMYIGSTNEPNIFKCKVRGVNDIRGYQWGLRNPFTGETNNLHMSYDEDSAILHRFTQFGICVLDPTRTMSLIPSVLAA